MLSLILPFISSWLPSLGKSLVDAYQAKLSSDNTSEKIKADLAAKDMDLALRERELATQVTIAEEGRWWTALPRWLMAMSVAVYFTKCIVWDKVLAWGVTDPLAGDVQNLAIAVVSFYFGGRTLEKLVRIAKR